MGCCILSPHPEGRRRGGRGRQTTIRALEHLAAAQSGGVGGDLCTDVSSVNSAVFSEHVRTSAPLRKVPSFGQTYLLFWENATPFINAKRVCVSA